MSAPGVPRVARVARVRRVEVPIPDKAEEGGERRAAGGTNTRQKAVACGMWPIDTNCVDYGLNR